MSLFLIWRVGEGRRSMMKKYKWWDLRCTIQLLFYLLAPHLQNGPRFAVIMKSSLFCKKKHDSPPPHENIFFIFWHALQIRLLPFLSLSYLHWLASLNPFSAGRQEYLSCLQKRCGICVHFVISEGSWKEGSGPLTKAFSCGVKVRTALQSDLERA